jgi:hypothetical protein
MANIIIPVRHQSAPSERHDPVLAREAAAVRDPKAAAREDWEAIDWEAANPQARRGRMVNQDFDREFDSPGFHDPALRRLQERAYLEKLELRPQEWVDEGLELYELNCAKARAQQLPGQARWEGRENEAARMVNILHPSAVMRKLQRAGVDARDYEHPHARIWLNDWTRAGLVGVNAWVSPQPMDKEGYLVSLSHASSQAQKELITSNFLACREGRKVQRTLTSLQEPYGPEWSIMRFDARGVAKKEKYRGWRTAMLVLIVAEVLTEREVDRAFGPALGEAGAWYRQQLQAWRQIRIGRPQ